MSVLATFIRVEWNIHSSIVITLSPTMYLYGFSDWTVYGQGMGMRR